MSRISQEREPMTQEEAEEIAFPNTIIVKPPKAEAEMRGQ